MTEPLSPIQYEKSKLRNQAEINEYNKLKASQTKLGKAQRFIGKGISNVLRPQGSRSIPRANPTQQLSAAQGMLKEMFNGEQTFGTGKNLPVINGELRTGGGLIKNGDFNRQTGRMFGLR